MRQHIPALVAGLIAGAIPGAYAVFHKPAPTVVQPVTVASGSAASAKTEQRRAASAWGDLAQPEVDALAKALQAIHKSDVVIFCKDDARCGDMALDFENAFETARWTVRQETPLIDDTVGIATSREDIRQAIDAATSGRLKVKMLTKNADYDVLAIGRKPK